MVYSSTKMKEWDLASMHAQSISSWELMERAASECVRWLTDHVASPSFFIICGRGNNGGDGLAMARMLLQEGKQVRVFCIPSDKARKKDAQSNFELLQQLYPETFLSWEESMDHLHSDPGLGIIDAVFGYSFHGKLDADILPYIQFLNQASHIKIAIDLPSGIDADGDSPQDMEAFRADYTLTFQAYKLSLLLPETGRFAGKVIVLDIGLDQEFEAAQHLQYRILPESVAVQLYKPGSDFAHKGTHGHALLIGGSYGKMGAIGLAAGACIRSGAGLTTILAPGCGDHILQSRVPEAMFIKAGTDYVSTFNAGDIRDKVIGIGPGLGTKQETSVFFRQLLQVHRTPMLLDADALNLIAADPALFRLIPPYSILTPHPGEFDRLFGAHPDSLSRIRTACSKSKELMVIIVLKGHRTFIVSPDGKGYFNLTGNSGLAKGGSGDVLSGMLTALLARGYPPLEAATLGVYLHGKAADIAIGHIAPESLTASDVIANISKAFVHLSATKRDPKA